MFVCVCSCVCVCVCVCARARACVRACVRVRLLPLHNRPRHFPFQINRLTFKCPFPTSMPLRHELSQTLPNISPLNINDNLQCFMLLFFPQTFTAALLTETQNTKITPRLPFLSSIVEQNVQKMERCK
jgi:hypothetical protein